MQGGCKKPLKKHLTPKFLGQLLCGTVCAAAVRELTQLKVIIPHPTTHKACKAYY